jgi:hypothetical protein
MNIVFSLQAKLARKLALALVLCVGVLQVLFFLSSLTVSEMEWLIPYGNRPSTTG